MCCDVAGAQAEAESRSRGDWIRCSSVLPTAGPRVLTQKQALEIRLCHEQAHNSWSEVFEVEAAHRAVGKFETSDGVPLFQSTTCRPTIRKTREILELHFS